MVVREWDAPEALDPCLLSLEYLLTAFSMLVFDELAHSAWMQSPFCQTPEIGYLQAPLTAPIPGSGGSSITTTTATTTDESSPGDEIGEENCPVLEQHDRRALELRAGSAGGQIVGDER